MQGIAFSAQRSLTQRCGATPIIDARDSDRQTLADAILRHLTMPPFHLVVRGFDVEHGRDAVPTLISTMAPSERLSFTRVRIDADAANKASRGTRYSRTNQPLTLHTDTAHAARPHALVAFHMIRPDDAGGGRSVVIPAGEVVDRLDRCDVAALRAPRFDFGKGAVPILWGPAHHPSIRYYRAQIDARAAATDPLVPKDAALFDRLDAALAACAVGADFALRTGDLLLINNHKALHARTGFNAASDRLMLRYRLRVDGLE